MHLLLFYVKKNYALIGAPDITQWLVTIGGKLDCLQYNNMQGIKEMIYAQASVMERYDYKLARSMADNLGIYLAMDGQRKNGQSLKVFTVSGVPEGAIESKQMYLDLLSMNKTPTKHYHIDQHTSINKPKDQMALIDEIMLKLNRSYSRLNGISSDGDMSTLGTKSGVLSLIQQTKNERSTVFSVFCHRLNIVISAPFATLPFLLDHLTQIRDITDLFNHSIPNQILHYVQHIEKVKQADLHKPYENRWNFMVKPIEDIYNNLASILQSLNWMRVYREEEKAKTRARRAWVYWSSVEKVVLNMVCLAFAKDADLLLKNMSKRGIDKVAAMVYIYEYIDTMKTYRDHGLTKNNAFIIDECRKFIYKQKNENGRTKYIVRFMDHKWENWDHAINVNGYIDKTAMKMAKQIILKYIAKFSSFERVVYQNMVAAFDPAQYLKFAELKDIKNYGNDQVEKVMVTKLRMKNTHGQRLYEFPTDFILAQFEISKQALWEHRHIMLPEKRMAAYYRSILSKKALYRDLIDFLKEEITANVQNVELERYFSKRTWIHGRFRCHMGFSLLSACMRLIVNAPDPKSDDIKAFMVESALKWYSTKPRRWKYDILDELKAKAESVGVDKAVHDYIKAMEISKE